MFMLFKQKNPKLFLHCVKNYSETSQTQHLITRQLMVDRVLVQLTSDSVYVEFYRTAKTSHTGR